MTGSLNTRCSLYKLLLFWLLCCSQLGIQAQTRIEISTDPNWNRTLVEELEVMSDEQREWSAEALFATSADLFEPNSSDSIPMLHNYWARFSLANTSESDQWLSFESYYWDYVTLYFRDSTGNVTLLPFGILSNPNTNKFLVPRKTEYEVLANFESIGQFRRESNINLVVKPTLPALESKTFTNYMDGIIFGIIFGLACYNFFLFISIRDRTYLWYSLFILSLALSFMTLFANTAPKWTQFFTSDHPFIAFYIKKVADPIAWIAYINFVRYFLVIKERYPMWDKVLKTCIGLIMLQFIINVSGVYRFSGVTRSLSWNLPVIICVSLAIYSYFKGYSKAKFFIIGQLFLVSGVVITQMYYAGLDVIYFLPETAFVNYFRSPSSVFAFTAVEAIVFSFAMADKYNILQRDITKVKFEKEKEKRDMLASQNELLERTVLDRTQEIQQKNDLLSQQTEKLLELDDAKTQLYTNITHEFRTPLTVIQGMTNNLLEDPEIGRIKNAEKSLSLIDRNGSKLLQLINEMLDLAKLESGNMELSLQQSDIVPYVKYLSESFHSVAQQKNINLTIYAEVDQLEMDFDAKKLASIISNLISNAIKYTPEQGKIIVHLSKTQEEDCEWFSIKVKDTGIGLSEKDIPNVFDKFYQVNDSSTRPGEGTGIGLSLVKELVEIMHGRITVESTLSKGSSFKVQLPISNLAKTVLEPIPTSSTETIDAHKQSTQELAESIENSELPLALLMEDNKDVAYYIENCLEEEYLILYAENGKLGVEMAFEYIPDIIISDVMMPEMDGFEACSMLKQDERTNHIPIILLTAKAASEDKISGLSHGADAYLIKPFEKKELLLRMEKLMEIRKTLQAKYSTMEPSETSTQVIENGFVKRFYEIIEEHILEEDFSIEDLADQLHLSRSQVHRKIKGLTGMSTSLYVRHIRLQKAKTLLTTTDLNISEIAYRTGFKTPIYFSQVFKESFGVSPSESRKKS